MTGAILEIVSGQPYYLEMSVDPAFRQHVLSASIRPEVISAVGQIYADLQTRIDRRRPQCVASGRCCRFEEFGHRLFVSTLEMAAFVSPADLAGPIINGDGVGCPYQQQRLCSVHAIRPFGCRMFFCDATATPWQNEQYEIFHARLKALHESLRVPYFYVEWREAIQALRVQEERMKDEL